MRQSVRCIALALLSAVSVAFVGSPASAGLLDGGRSSCGCGGYAWSYDYSQSYVETESAYPVTDVYTRADVYRRTHVYPQTVVHPQVFVHPQTVVHPTSYVYAPPSQVYGPVETIGVEGGGWGGRGCCGGYRHHYGWRHYY